MDNFEVYDRVAKRTGGDIYIGVVGPVRTGKSTFIKRFMEKMVLPGILDENKRVRAQDELPQSGDGKTIMTTEPKFVPAEAVGMEIMDGAKCRVRMIDCVGFPVDGAIGGEENGKPRMVRTPWSEEEMSFVEAAETGTRKVIEEHSTIAIMMTTDGSITGLDRAKYLEAEERVVESLKKSNKPFIVVINSKEPTSENCVKLAGVLTERYGTGAYSIDVSKMTEEDMADLLGKVLLEFPIRKITCNIPKWMQVLPVDNQLISEVIESVKVVADKIEKISDYKKFGEAFGESKHFQTPVVTADLSTGTVMVAVEPNPDEFYKTLSAECGVALEDDYKLLSYVRRAKVAEDEYSKLKNALDDVREYGYGIVQPTEDEMTLDEPSVFKQGNRFGVKLRATAPSLHIMKVDVECEVSPILGTDRQGEDMANYLMSEFETNPAGIWDMDMFGKSMNSLVRENLAKKLQAVPDEARVKMRKTLGRIVNEGKGGVICILL